MHMFSPIPLERLYLEPPSSATWITPFPDSDLAPSLCSFLSTAGLGFLTMATHQNHPWGFQYIHKHIHVYGHVPIPTYTDHTLWSWWFNRFGVGPRNLYYYKFHTVVLMCSQDWKSIRVIFPDTALTIPHKALHGQATLNFMFLKCVCFLQSTHKTHSSLAFIPPNPYPTSLPFHSSKKPSLAPFVPN